MYKNPVFLIVDDERLSRNYIKDLLEEFMPDATVLETRSAEGAQAILSEGAVDVLLLDIKMPGMDGFELLQSLNEKNFELIFITAHSHYAIQAIRQDACDYLLKPVKKTDFRDMLFRVIERREKAKERIHNKSSATDNYLEQKLTINHQQGTNFIRLKDILYLKANNTYTTLYLVTGQKITTSKPINRFEASLSSDWFFRIHKSFIINTSHFKEYLSANGNFAVMNNGDRLYISRYRLAAFLEKMKKESGDIGL